MANDGPVPPANVAPQQQQVAGIRFSDDSGGINAEIASRTVRYVYVAVDELEDLKSSSSALELGMFGICFGALLTCGVTLLTVPLTNLVTQVVFPVATMVFGVFTVFFGLGTIRAERRWRKRVDRLKSGGKPA